MGLSSPFAAGIEAASPPSSALMIFRSRRFCFFFFFTRKALGHSSDRKATREIVTPNLANGRDQNKAKVPGGTVSAREAQSPKKTGVCSVLDL